MKQAIQLEIQFDDQAIPMPAVAAAPSPVRSLTTTTDAAELRVLAAVHRAALKAQAALPSLTLAVQAAACMAFAFSLLFISAIIGG